MATIGNNPAGLPSTTRAFASPAAAGPYLVKRSAGLFGGVSPSCAVLTEAVRSIVQREGEDAGLTGMTRSLHRRLLALNVHGRVESALPAKSAGWESATHDGLTA